MELKMQRNKTAIFIIMVFLKHNRNDVEPHRIQYVKHENGQHTKALKNVTERERTSGKTKMEK